MSVLPWLLALALPAAAADREPYGAEELALVRQVTEVRLSPDGRTAAFVTDISGALEVWSVPAAGGWPVQLSSLGEQAAALEFSPDGRWIVFASDFGGDERPDLYVVPSGGGRVVNITRSTQAETSPAFSPDGARLAYLADPGAPFLSQVMVMDLGSRRVRQLTRETVNLHDPVWSSDGQSIAVTRSGDDHQGELLLVDVETEQVRVVDPPVPGGIIFAQDFSENGRTLLSLSRNATGFMQLYLLDVASGKGRFVGPSDWDVETASLHPKAGIIFKRNEGGSAALYRMKGPQRAEPLFTSGGWIEDYDLDEKGRTLAFVLSDSRRPPDVWVMDLKKKRPVQVTWSGLGGVKPDELAPGRWLRYPSFDGQAIHALSPAASSWATRRPWWWRSTGARTGRPSTTSRPSARRWPRRASSCWLPTTAAPPDTAGVSRT
jgi:Tol biopolymer transport system component